MRDKLATFCFFFPEPMEGIDQANTLTAGVQRVQLFLGVASDPRQADQLRWLSAHGIRVILRLDEPNPGQEAGTYYDAGARSQLVVKVRYVQSLVPVEAVIVGNEPEFPYDLTWRSSNWGNTPDAFYKLPGGKAQAHCEAVAAMVPLLKSLGVKVVSSGWKHRRVRPRQPGQPGQASWRELTAPAYNICDSNGSHIYMDSAISEEDTNRYLWTFGEEVARCHKGVWINETSTNSAPSDVARMQAIMADYDLLAASEDAGRVESFCSFVNNGLPGQSWSNMIMRAPAAYAVLGLWMRP